MQSKRSLSTDSQEQNRLRKALRESELLRELAELLASSLDPTRILQVLVRRATEVCDVSRCTVWLLDESHTRFLPSAYHMSTQNIKSKVLQAADRVWRHSSIAFDNSVIQQLLHENGLLSLHDLSTEITLLPLAEKFFVRSVLLVALIREDRPVGMMSLDNPGQCTEFSNDQLQMARAIGQQAAVAIDNARLYQEAQIERKRAERLIERAQSIYQVAMAVNSGDDLSDVLEIAVQHLTRGLHTDQAAIALLEQDRLVLANRSSLALVSSAPPSLLTTFENCCATIKQQTPLFMYHEQLTQEEQSWFNHLSMTNILIIPLLVGGTHHQIAHQPECVSSHEKHCVGFAFVNYRQTSKPPSSGYIAFAQDIAAHCALAIEKARHLAESQRVEALANERANTLNAVFNAMTEGLIVCDADGKVMLSNENASRFLGLTGKTKKQLATYLQHHPVYTLTGQQIAPEHFPLTRALHGERVRGERYLDTSHDGAEHAIEVNIEPLLDNDQKKIGIVSAFRDITEQVRVERRIRRALDTMLHAAEAVSGITNIKEILYRVLAMTLTALNCERGVVQIYQDEQQEFVPLLSIGFTEDEVQSWLSEQAGWFSPGANQYNGFQEQLKDGHATLFSEEHVISTLGNSEIINQTLVLATPITHNKHLLGVMLLDRSTYYKKTTTHFPGATRPLAAPGFNAWDMAVVEGIAQFAGLAIEQTRWQQEAEIARTNEATMRESNALKDEFLAITAHEFRTPLTIILAHSQMMSRLLGKAVEVVPELKERLNESISYIEEQTRQLTNIVNTFLEVTRLNRGQIELNSEELNLADLIKETVHNQSTTSAIHHISLSIGKAHKPYMIQGDRARLQQIFVNLLQNAIKYSPDGGPITITMAQRQLNNEAPHIEITIADKGIGVPLQAQQHLFERFYRAPNIGNSQTRGVGLGLYVVAEFLHLHDGTIEVESSGIAGEGSCFTVRLPLFEKNSQSI
ncbi:sensor histidine kinase [Dictyobacter formicarum]|uniref:histidine kinase n=1 Tax=Dictyobacter formicarum TaxID=2778368 RepID=A0ABQ3VA64_9CHLR|nr:ATP-binding protein [Dictyobacter formicarum]GHO82889.1 hypothetical protein KSZ_08950 [Dictyobacter formicarum]